MSRKKIMATEKTIQTVYELMLGERQFPVAGVADAFADGSICEKKYTEMRMAYARVCQRLRTGDEDADLERMVDALEAICRELCFHMFQYGMMYANHFECNKMEEDNK